MLQVPLQGFLVRQQAVQRAVQPVVVHLIRRHPQQILQRRPLVPPLRDRQFARRLTQTRHHQNRHDRRPRRRLPTFRHQLPTRHVQAQRLPQRPRKPHVPKRTATLQAHTIQPHARRRHRRRASVKQRRLRVSPRDLPCQHLRARTSLGVQFPELRQGLLDHFPAAANRAHQTPVDVILPVLSACAAAQVHRFLPTPLSPPSDDDSRG